jgi:glycogen operon protein
MGVRLTEGGASVAVWSAGAEAVWFCLFDPAGDREIARYRLLGRDGDVFHGFVPGVGPGALYGLRADGPWDPARGHRFDPAKLLADPYATRIDRPFAFAPELAAPRPHALDTAGFMPRCVVEDFDAPHEHSARKRPRPRAPGLIYETPVRAFSMRRDDIAPQLRGTLGALAQPAAIDHLLKVGVTHVELMPVAAWMDEPHLVHLGLANAWGYNPVCMMALDPRIAPGGLDDLSALTARLRAAGIGVLLDVVFNHTAESDLEGPTLSMRGLDNAAYYMRQRDDPGALVNDTGCGNTLACNRPHVTRLLMDTMRHFVERAGVDGFRFDLAPVLGRRDDGFDPHAPLIVAMTQDPVLRDAIHVAEPWDVGPGGYQLGAFPTPFLEWNDRWRDDVRRFWRGDFGAIGAFATRLAGSRDIFAHVHRPPSASVNFVAAHDGFTLRDLVSYEAKHNAANGEHNRDGANINHSWNNGVEGPAGPAIEAARERDVRALIATTLLSFGTPMLTAGDEFGRTQAGNNNAYCQDNDLTWLDWAHADSALIAFTGALARLRARLRILQSDARLTGAALPGSHFPDASWLRLDGTPKQGDDWVDGDCVVLLTACPGPHGVERALFCFNRAREARSIALPEHRPGWRWRLALDSARAICGDDADSFDGCLHARSVSVMIEERAG